MSETATLDTTTHEYLIPERNLTYLTFRIEKLNKRARKLGVAEITILVDHESPTITEERSEVTGEITKMIIWFPVSITGQTPKFEDWTFLAALSPTPEGTLAAIVPGQTLPKKYYDTTLDCDHCGHNRRRNRVYVVQHDDGTTKQVGSTCIADFLGGQNPHNIATWSELYREFIGGMGDLEDANRMPRGRGFDEYGLASFLTMVAFVVRNVGWVSRSRAYEEGGRATVDLVENLIGSDENWKLFVAKHDKPTDADRTRADEAIEWAHEIPADDANDYLRNLGIISRLGSVAPRFVGYAGSIIIAHDKALERVRERKIGAASEHFGTIKKRYDLVLTVLGCTECEGYMPDSVNLFYRMRDADGNLFVWYCTNGVELDNGETYKIRGTIKDHTEYKDSKQTKLTRCAVGDLVENTVAIEGATA